MAGIIRMESLHELLHEAYNKKHLVGDFLEAGVWRGGCSIYAKGFMEAYKISHSVWVVDSFQGMPGKEHQRDSDIWEGDASVSQEHVRDHFDRHHLLDSNVKFVKGFFGDTLPLLRRRIGRLICSTCANE